ncbi:MAG: hypothetical protein LUG60_05555 [Erysipelotrichaceae bacterium]|nr:hypothetical protein [Erysipelotrichaceae bacterium]
MVIVECDYYRKILNKFLDNNKIQTFYLLKHDNGNFINIKEEKYIDKITLAYLGSINNLIDIDKIELVIKKLQMIKPVKLKVIGTGEKKDIFLNRMNSINVETEYFGMIFDENRKSYIFQDCYFGINIYKNNVEIGLTMKSVDYFQMGLPILNSIKGDTEELVKSNSLGININEFYDYEVLNYLNNIYEVKNHVREFYMRNFDDCNVDIKMDKIFKNLF